MERPPPRKLARAPAMGRLRSNGSPLCYAPNRTRPDAPGGSDAGRFLGHGAPLRSSHGSVMTSSSPVLSSAVWHGLIVSISGAVLISFETLLLRLVAADIWTVIWWRGILLGATVLLYTILSSRSVRSLRLHHRAE